MFADGVLLLSPAANPEHVADLRIFNPDGSEAELSGNGAREAILYLRRRGWTDEDEFAIETAAGEITPDDHRPGHVHGRHGQGEPDLQGLPGGPPDGRGKLHARTAREHGSSACLDRQPAVRDPRRPT